MIRIIEVRRVTAKAKMQAKRAVASHRFAQKVNVYRHVLVGKLYVMVDALIRMTIRHIAEPKGLVKATYLQMLTIKVKIAQTIQRINCALEGFANHRVQAVK